MLQSLKVRSVTTIQYILISEGSPYESPILPPEDFNNTVVDFIEQCPMDILQLHDSLDYLELYLRELRLTGYTFKVINIKDREYLLEVLKRSPCISLLFLNANNFEHSQLYQRLIELKYGYCFFHFYGSDSNIDMDFVVNDPDQFLFTIIEKQKEILKYLKIKDFIINPSLALEYRNYNPFHCFTPTKSNYFIINKIIGNFCVSLNEKELSTRIKEESFNAIIYKHSFHRQKLFIEQIKKIDYFITVSYRSQILKPVSPSQSILSPLILLAPFNNPDLKKLHGDEIELALVEQTENYINVPSKQQLDSELILLGMKVQRLRLNYLSQISILHSSFCFSPVIRLPLKGKSMYRFLSFFRTEAFANLSLIRNRKNLKKSIHQFGKNYKEAVISQELGELIKKRNGQIVAISDLPIEWLIIEGIPLSFTHDVCRLPENSMHGLMSLFMINQAMEFRISKNIIKKTLVIIGAQDEEFLRWQKQAIALSQTLGFHVRICSNNEEVKTSISEIKPEFLIFDCHGDYDEITQSTFLHIGKDKLDGKFVVENYLSAPIVFLSACGTAPTYGTIQPIANAFFEVGALSVTSTYLPIAIDSSSILYLRILANLSYCCDKGVHKNWLEFVCHIIRTSTISGAYLNALKKKNEKLFEFLDSMTKSQSDSMVFSQRRKLFKDLDNRIKSLTIGEKNYYSEEIPEYLLYSNMGRGDLILFDSWREEYLKKNGVQNIEISL